MLSTASYFYLGCNVITARIFFSPHGIFHRAFFQHVFFSGCFFGCFFFLGGVFFFLGGVFCLVFVLSWFSPLAAFCDFQPAQIPVRNLTLNADEEEEIITSFQPQHRTVTRSREMHTGDARRAPPRPRRHRGHVTRPHLLPPPHVTPKHQRDTALCLLVLLHLSAHFSDKKYI